MYKPVPGGIRNITAEKGGKDDPQAVKIPAVVFSCNYPTVITTTFRFRYIPTATGIKNIRA
jgi:hypothetical protein